MLVSAWLVAWHTDQHRRQQMSDVRLWCSCCEVSAAVWSPSTVWPELVVSTAPCSWEQSAGPPSITSHHPLHHRQLQRCCMHQAVLSLVQPGHTRVVVLYTVQQCLIEDAKRCLSVACLGLKEIVVLLAMYYAGCICRPQLKCLR